MSIVETLVLAASSVVAAPLVGGLLAGIDRKLTARMQSRRGPPILQPFTDASEFLVSILSVRE